jgi:hypothetical protein
MGLWELAWWEIIVFVIGFCVIVYLIIKAPGSPDLTKKSTYGECASGKYSSDKPILPDEPKE